MFQNLFVYEKQRTGVEALGFYLVHLLLIIVLSALLGVFFADGFDAGVRLGTYVGTVFCLAMSFLVLVKKKKLGKPGLIVIAILSGLGAFLMGGLLGLVATAYLTTIEPEQ